MIPPKIYGLIGYPVKHSLSPAMHNAAFKYLKETKKIDYEAEYRLFEVKPEKLEDFLLKNIEVQDTKGESFFSQDIVGFNITIPHKVRAKEILEKRFPFDNSKERIVEDEYYVKLSGAINTVKRNKETLHYYNTDARGFLDSLMDKEYLRFEPYGKKVLLIGCGGAGRAIIASLSWKNVGVKNIYINDINDEAVVSAKKHFSQLPQHAYLEEILEFVLAKDIPQVINDCHLLINASPVGMEEGDGPVADRSLLHKNLSVYDVVYNKETQLIKDAKSLGLPAVNGLGMLLYQGVDAFELWTGQKAPVEVMRKALREATSK